MENGRHPIDPISAFVIFAVAAIALVLVFKTMGWV